MNKNDYRNKIIRLFIIVFIILFFIAGIFSYKFIQHERNQQERFNDLQSKVDQLSGEIQSLQVSASAANSRLSDLEKDITSSRYSSEAYNYLAIGNSITVHPICDYWWDEIGMAASDAEHDYYHLVVAALKDEKTNVCSACVNLSLWELQDYDRTETLSLLDSYLSENLDLITIQLGDNVPSDSSTFSADWDELLQTLRNHCPNAAILIVDNYLEAPWTREIKKDSAAEYGFPFVDLTFLRGNSEYECGLGTIVYDAEGNPHSVEHGGVASHPGDKAMQFIANGIIEAWEKN